MKRANRKTPLTPSQAARYSKRNGQRRPGDRYDANTYARAITRACEIAFEIPDELRKISAGLTAAKREMRKQLAIKWRAKHCWSPNQLRHTRATRIREKYGIAAAATVLGHIAELHIVLPKVFCHFAFCFCSRFSQEAVMLGSALSKTRLESVGAVGDSLDGNGIAQFIISFTAQKFLSRFLEGDHGLEGF